MNLEPCLFGLFREIWGLMLMIWRGSFRGPLGLRSSRVWEPIEIGGTHWESPVTLKGRGAWQGCLWEWVGTHGELEPEARGL